MTDRQENRKEFSDKLKLKLRTCKTQLLHNIYYIVCMQTWLLFWFHWNKEAKFNWTDREERKRTTFSSVLWKYKEEKRQEKKKKQSKSFEKTICCKILSFKSQIVNWTKKTQCFWEKRLEFWIIKYNTSLKALSFFLCKF